MGSLSGKVGLVTGSGRGLGRACAQLLSREGAKVVIVDINRENGEETVKLIKASGGEASFKHTDLSKPEDVVAMVKYAEDTYGGLDCAINNAVLSLSQQYLADITLEDFRRAEAVNFTGVFMCIKTEIQAMLKRGGGSIVSIGSGGEMGANRGSSAYLGAKHGVYGMTKSAAVEYGEKNIRINAVGPGCMWTPLMRERAATTPGHTERLKKMSPMNRIAEPEEVAEAAVWLCTPKASFVTGHTLVADGGAMVNRTSS